MAVVMRICLQRMDLTTPDPLLLDKHAAGHTLAAVIALLVSPLLPCTPTMYHCSCLQPQIFTVAPRAIRINMAPLFGTTSSAPVQLEDSPEPSPATRLDETKSIADLLDEISRSPTTTRPASPVDASPVDVSPCIPRRTNNFLPMGHAHMQAAQALTAHLQQIDHLNLSQQQQLQQQLQQQYPPQRPPRNNNIYEEMDWDPTPTSPTPSSPLFASPNPQPEAAPAQSNHRAFATQGERATQPFGSAPIEPRKGPFWYRVPPAPTTPAQRVFNPPNQPRLRSSPVEAQAPGAAEGVRFRLGGGGMGMGGSFGRDGALQQQEQQQQQSRELQHVAFAEPSFFAERVVGGGVGSGGQGGRSDPRNELSGMFGDAFKLDGEERKVREGGWLTRVLKGGDGKKA
jgi:hypothetical protein